uniref:Uncharacterized protein n=1 Tax=Ignisphaera aggregans TaxID=334771 RepID=A0A7J3Z6G0_9CREN
MTEGKLIREFSPVEKLTIDEFKKYLQTVSKLNAIASKIEEWCDKNIWSVIGGSQTEEAKVPFDKLPKEIEKIVVSGLRVEQYKNPYYATNAYAMFVKDFLGIELENPAILVEKLSFGEDLSDINMVFKRTEFMEFVNKVREITDFILKIASELGVKVEPSEVVEKPIHELIEEFIQKAYEVTVGVNEFVTSVWGLRKIMPSYMKKVYGDVPQQALTLLGFKKLLEVKHVELWGFEDYFTRSAVCCMSYCTAGGSCYAYPYLIVNNVPIPSGFRDNLYNYTKDVAEEQRILAEVERLHSLTTLGGAICSLSQTVWSYTRRLSNTLKKWFKEYVNLEIEYVREAWKRLGTLGWRVPEYFFQSRYHDITSYHPYFKEGFVYDENGVIEHVILQEERSCGWYKERPRITLIARILYDLAPAILLGVSDVVLKLRLYGERRFYNEHRYTYTYSDVSRYEDVNAIVVFFRGERE